MTDPAKQAMDSAAARYIAQGREQGLREAVEICRIRALWVAVAAIEARIELGAQRGAEAK